MTYHIAMLTSEGINKLETFQSYSDAEMYLDGWCDVYPNAWIEIMNDADLDHASQYND
jgi:hypothetical protein